MRQIVARFSRGNDHQLSLLSVRLRLLFLVLILASALQAACTSERPSAPVVDASTGQCLAGQVHQQLPSPQSGTPEINIYWDNSGTMRRFAASKNGGNAAFDLLWENLESIWLRHATRVQAYRHFAVAEGVNEITRLMDNRGRTIRPTWAGKFTHLALASYLSGKGFAENPNLVGSILISDLILEVPSANEMRKLPEEFAAINCQGQDLRQTHSFTPSLFGACFAETLSHSQSSDLQNLTVGVIMIRVPVWAKTKPSDCDSIEPTSPLFILWFIRGAEMAAQTEAVLLEALRDFCPSSQVLLPAADRLDMGGLGTCGFRNTEEARSTFPIIATGASRNCDFYCQGSGKHMIRCQITDPKSPSFKLSLSPEISEVHLNGLPTAVVPCSPNGGRCVNVETVCKRDGQGQIANPRIELFHRWQMSSVNPSESVLDECRSWIGEKANSSERIAALIEQLRYSLTGLVALPATAYEIKYH